MKDQEIFLTKMKAMSLIKKELIKIGKDPGLIEIILMDEYDQGLKNGISAKMTSVDLDDPAGIAELMVMVRKKL